MDSLLVLATSNANKLKEIKELLKDFPVTIKSLADFGPMPEAIEDGATFDENAYKKALHYAGRSRSPSPAVGHMADHVREQQQLVADALVNPFNDQVAE